jgi:hypothetical protein
VINSVRFTDERSGVAVGEWGRILRTSDGGVNWVSDEQNQPPGDPHELFLEQNYPNPFNPMTTIRFSIMKLDHVRLIIYDLLGREVKTLVDERRMPGSYEVTLTGRGLASGLYLCRLTVGNSAATRKLLLLR